MTDAISVAGLVKTFRSTRALDGTHLPVRTGNQGGRHVPGVYQR